MTTHSTPPPPRESLSVKSLDAATASRDVDSLSFWISQAELHNAPRRAIVACLHGWCVRVAQSAGAALTVAALAVTE